MKYVIFKNPENCPNYFFLSAVNNKMFIMISNIFESVTHSKSLKVYGIKKFLHKILNFSFFLSI